MKGYEEELLEWRRMLDEALRREDGWLALAGLHWLHPGKNTFGSGEGNDIVLPAEEGVPQRAGSFELNENAVILHVEQPGTVKVGEKEAQNLELRCRDGLYLSWPSEAGGDRTGRSPRHPCMEFKEPGGAEFPGS